MNIFKKSLIFLILFVLTITNISLRATGNSLDVFYFNETLTIDGLSASLYTSDESFIISFEKGLHAINGINWFHFYLEDYSLDENVEYLLIIENINESDQLKYTITSSLSTYYINKHTISGNINDLANEITYATFITRKQIKFFTKQPIQDYEMKLLKNDTYIEKEDYTFKELAGQYFINLTDDVDFSYEYYIEITTLDGLTLLTTIVLYNELYKTNYFETLFNYSGNDLGLDYVNYSATFKVWAPSLNELTLNLYSDTLLNLKTEIPMEKLANGVFYHRRYQDLNNYEYTYSFTRAGITYEVIDPYVKYIKNNRGLIVDLNQFNPAGFNSFKPAANYSSKAEFVVYESSVKQLTKNLGNLELNGSFAGLMNKDLSSTNNEGVNLSIGLGHLKDLGVTHLTLSDLVTTDYSLSTINQDFITENIIASEIKDLKQLIKTLGENEINVILELNLYNKVINSLEALMPGYYYESKEGSVIKNDELAFFETDHYMTNLYLESQITYLLNEFKFKGLKLNPLNSLSIEYLNGKIRETSLDKSFLFYGEFNDLAPTNMQNKLSSTTSLDSARHVGFIDEDRFSLDIDFLDSTSNNGLKGYILSSWTDTYNTISPEQSFKRLDYFDDLLKSENKQIKTIQLLSYGIVVIKAGEEIGFYSDLPIDYRYKHTNYSLFKMYQELLLFKKEHPSLQILDDSKLRSEVLYSAKNNVIEYQIINSKDSYPHILIIHNLGTSTTTTLPEGLKGLSHYNLDGELKWSLVYDSLNPDKTNSKFESKSTIELEKNQSLILHFGLNTENIIKDPIPVPTPPKESNLLTYLLISGGVIIVLGIVLTYFILNSTKKEEL